MNTLDEAYEEYLKMKPSDEMVDHFNKRTRRHIELVRKYVDRIDELHDFRFSLLMLNPHDESKFSDPEFLPYVYTTWSYYCKDNDIEFEVPEVIMDRMNEATIHHIVNNAHHPEFHDPNFDPESMFNNNNRDGVPTKMVDATLMSDVYIAEMVCDWCAVSEERGTNPNDWAKMNINKRWEFTEYQSNLIYELISKIWVDKK